MSEQRQGNLIISSNRYADYATWLSTFNDWSTPVGWKWQIDGLEVSKKTFILMMADTKILLETYKSHFVDNNPKMNSWLKS